MICKLQDSNDAWVKALMECKGDSALKSHTIDEYDMVNCVHELENMYSNVVKL